MIRPIEFTAYDGSIRHINALSYPEWKFELLVPERYEIVYPNYPLGRASLDNKEIDFSYIEPDANNIRALVIVNLNPTYAKEFQGQTSIEYRLDPGPASIPTFMNIIESCSRILLNFNPDNSIKGLTISYTAGAFGPEYDDFLSPIYEYPHLIKNKY